MLWRRVGGARSAGRVQSVATRLVVERERERMAFRAADYWDLDGRFSARGVTFNARLVELDSHRVATSRDFDPATGALAEGSGAVHLREADAGTLATRLRDVGLHGRLRGVEAVHRATEAAVQDDDAAAGGRQQAALQRRAHDVGRAGPLRARLHHLHAYRLREALRAGGRRGPGADRRAVRPGVPAAGAADVRQQGQERGGGPRGDPPVRRPVPHPRAGPRRAQPGRAGALRAGLDAHGREPDARRPRPQPHAAPRRARRPRASTRSSARRGVPTSSSGSAWRTWTSARSPSPTRAR